METTSYSFWSPARAAIIGATRFSSSTRDEITATFSSSIIQMAITPVSRAYNIIILDKILPPTTSTHSNTVFNLRLQQDKLNFDLRSAVNAPQCVSSTVPPFVPVAAGFAGSSNASK